MAFLNTCDNKNKVFECPHCGTVHHQNDWEPIEWWGKKVVRCCFCFKNTEVK